MLGVKGPDEGDHVLDPRLDDRPRRDAALDLIVVRGVGLVGQLQGKDGGVLAVLDVCLGIGSGDNHLDIVFVRLHAAAACLTACNHSGFVYLLKWQV